MKRSNDDLSVRDEFDATPTGDQSASRDHRPGPGWDSWMDDFTVEELARLHQKLDGWIRQRVPQTEHTVPDVGDAAQHGPSGVRRDAAGSHMAA